MTQRLGAASSTEDFYLVVAPHAFVKLHRGTWHAGLLWGEVAERVFYNIELHNTNEANRNKVVFDDTYTFEPCT